MRLAAESEARRKVILALKEQTTVERRPGSSYQVDIYSWNDKYCEKIDQRKEEEGRAEVASIQDPQAHGREEEEPEGEELHSLEKRLAAAQNWVVPPPSVKDPMFKLTAKPTSPIGWDGPETASPMRLIH